MPQWFSLPGVYRPTAHPAPPPPSISGVLVAPEVIWSTTVTLDVTASQDYAWILVQFRPGQFTGTEGVVRLSQASSGLLTYGHLDAFGDTYADGSAKRATARVWVTGGDDGEFILDGVTGVVLPSYDPTGNPDRPTHTVEQTDDVGTHYASGGGDWSLVESSPVHRVYQCEKRMGGFVLLSWDIVQSGSSARRCESVLVASNPVTDGTIPARSFRYPLQLWNIDFGGGDDVDTHSGSVSDSTWNSGSYTSIGDFLGDAQGICHRRDNLTYGVSESVKDTGWGFYQGYTRLPVAQDLADVAGDTSDYAADTAANRSGAPIRWDGNRFGGSSSAIVCCAYDDVNPTGHNRGYGTLPMAAWLALGTGDDSVIHALLDNCEYFWLKPYHFREANASRVTFDSHPNLRLFNHYRWGNTSGEGGRDQLGKPNPSTAHPSSTDWQGWADTDWAHYLTGEANVCYAITRSKHLEEELRHRIEATRAGPLSGTELGPFGSQDRGIGRSVRNSKEAASLLGISIDSEASAMFSDFTASRGTPLTASGGRTLTFDAATQTITASSGDFTGETGPDPGYTFEVAGTSSANDGKRFAIAAVSALAITLDTAGEAIVDSGPHSSSATLTYRDFGDVESRVFRERNEGRQGPHNNPDELLSPYQGHSNQTKLEHSGHLGMATDLLFEDVMPAGLAWWLDNLLFEGWRFDPPDPDTGWQVATPWDRIQDADWEDPSEVSSTPAGNGWGGSENSMWAAIGHVRHLLRGTPEQLARIISIYRSLESQRVTSIAYMQQGGARDQWGWFSAQMPIVANVSGTLTGAGTVTSAVTGNATADGVVAGDITNVTGLAIGVGTAAGIVQVSGSTTFDAAGNAETRTQATATATFSASATSGLTGSASFTASARSGVQAEATAASAIAASGAVRITGVAQFTGAGNAGRRAEATGVPTFEASATSGDPQGAATVEGSGLAGMQHEATGAATFSASAIAPARGTASFEAAGAATQRAEATASAVFTASAVSGVTGSAGFTATATASHAHEATGAATFQASAANVGRPRGTLSFTATAQSASRAEAAATATVTAEALLVNDAIQLQGTINATSELIGSVSTTTQLTGSI